jgi:hypothetical protein
MNTSLQFVVIAATVTAAALVAQQPTTVDVAKIGPQVGERVPAFSGRDQFGRTQTLDSIVGRDGAMLVFYRSADW